MVFIADFGHDHDWRPSDCSVQPYYQFTYALPHQQGA